jgi:aldose 1-epimerase
MRESWFLYPSREARQLTDLPANSTNRFTTPRDCGFSSTLASKAAITPKITVGSGMKTYDIGPSAARILLLGAMLCLTLAIGKGYAMPTVSQQPWGKTAAGENVDLYTIKNDNGMVAKIANYGATVTELHVSDRNGKMADVVLGYKTLDEYIASSPYFGCIVGRYGNRIALGKFSLDGNPYTLATNNDANHLHGGNVGFDKLVWKGQKAAGKGMAGVKLTLLSSDGDEGYPGDLMLIVTYWLTDDNELRIDYEATTSKPTTVNVTHHSYFNLKGEGDPTILDHKLMLNSRFFTPIDAGLIPTGEIRPVAGTPFDFTQPTAIGDRIESDNEQLKFGVGYDHNWVLDKKVNGEMTLAARVVESIGGRIMEVLTTEPGIQFYAGNFLDGTLTGKAGKPYPQRSGFCLETQHFPDSVNKAHFPSTILRPGETYKTSTVYRFSTEYPSQEAQVQ